MVNAWTNVGQILDTDKNWTNSGCPTLAWSTKGCTFDVPWQLMSNPEPLTTPLLLGIDINIIGLREVADSGGSFGVDMEYVYNTEIYKKFALSCVSHTLMDKGGIHAT